MSADRSRTEPRGPGPHPPALWTLVAAVAAGGILGAEARYGLGIAWPHGPDGWPWATFVVNVSGCLLIGALMVLVTEAFEPHPLVRPFLGVGVLGGYTTFSTYSVDVVALVVTGRAGLALAYLVLTPVAALLAVRAGITGTRTLAGVTPAAGR